MLAVENNNTSIVKTLIASHADVDVVPEVQLCFQQLYISDQDGWTALMFACWHGHTDIVDMLVKAGANMDATNKVQQFTL